MNVPTIEELEAARYRWFSAVEEAGQAQKHYESLVYALAKENNSQPFARPEDWQAYAEAQKAERDADRTTQIERTVEVGAGKAIPKESRERSCGHIQEWLDSRKKAGQS
jgi:hypothetical protein